VKRAIEADQPGSTDSTVERDALSVTRLVRTGSGQVVRLVRDELRLRRAEMRAKFRLAGTVVGLFGGAGVVVLYGVAALLVTLAALLATVVPAWVAALVVTVALLAVATVMAVAGRGRMRRVGSIVPKQTVDSVKADLRAVSTAAKRRRQR
jgi:hypothetical protein